MVRKRGADKRDHYADLPVGEIARLLEVAEGTVKSRLHSAVAALRSRMDDVEVT